MNISGTVEITRSFSAMNTDIEAVVCAPVNEQPAAEKQLLKIQEFFAEVEDTLSRFKIDSELSRLNRSAGTPFPASGSRYIRNCRSQNMPQALAARRME
jgi:thiamine biosynthesis lipoprotein ApbE